MGKINCVFFARASIVQSGTFLTATHFKKWYDAVSKTIEGCTGRSIKRLPLVE